MSPELWNQEWIKVPHHDYVIKYSFQEDSYSILISDLSIVYGEQLHEKEIEERFHGSNPYAEMKSKVIIKHVQNTLEDILAEKYDEIKLQCSPQNIEIHLQFSVSQVRFAFDLLPEALPPGQLRTNIIAPAILLLLHTCQENQALKKRIEDLEKISPISTSHKSKEEKKMKHVDFNMRQKDKVPATEILQSFVGIQKNITNYISYCTSLPENTLNDSTEQSLSRLCLPHANSSLAKCKTEPGHSSTPMYSSLNLPQKRTFETGVEQATSIKYEDDEKMSSKTTDDTPSLNDQLCDKVPKTANTREKKKRFLKKCF